MRTQRPRQRRHQWSGRNRRRGGGRRDVRLASSDSTFAAGCAARFGEWERDLLGGPPFSSDSAARSCLWWRRSRSLLSALLNLFGSRRRRGFPVTRVTRLEWRQAVMAANLFTTSSSTELSESSFRRLPIRAAAQYALSFDL